jgi:hypothetical protein
VAFLTCNCGHVIRDQTLDNPHKASLLAHQAEQRFWERPAAELAGLARAVKEGQLLAWLARHFGPEYPRDGVLPEVVEDYLQRAQEDLLRTVYQCERCGRLWVQDLHESETFHAFTPETAGGRDILRGMPGEPPQ